LWYLVYTDDEGICHSVCRTAEAIGRSLREGLLREARNIRVSRSKAGPFKSLRACTAYRDFAIEAAEAAVRGSASNHQISGVVKPGENEPTSPSDAEPATGVVDPAGGDNGDFERTVCLAVSFVGSLLFGLWWLWR
jgi:hypothetical protein